VVRILDTEDVARELDDRVLKAPSGSNQGDASLAREANAGQSPIHAAVRARRGDEDPAIVGEPLFGVVGANLRRWHPLERDAGIPEPLIRRLVCVIRSVEVSDDAHE